MSKPIPKPTPYSRERAVDLYFIENRGKVLDIAAFLDRVERAASERGAGGEGGDDFRVAALREAIAVLIDGRPNRAKRVLELLSDPTSDPIASAGTKGASGAFPGGKKSEGRSAGGSRA